MGRVSQRRRRRSLRLAFSCLASAALALAGAIAYERLGPGGLVAVAVAFVLPVVAACRWLAALQKARAERARAAEELRQENADLRELLGLAAGLAARIGDLDSLAAHATVSLARLSGGPVRIVLGEERAPGMAPLSHDGRAVGALSVERSDDPRWARLREPVEAQLAAALSAARLCEQERRAQRETIAALSGSIKAKEYVGGHPERVSEIAAALARRLGYTGHDLEAIRIGALLHGIGKIGIPDSILHKPGLLDNDEWAVMRRHPMISETILSGSELPPIVLQIARSSQERIDGTGYPDGLAGDEIPLPARIVLVADAFVALTTHRPYRRSRLPRAALEEILANRGTQFCPLVVGTLERLYREEPAVLSEGERLTIVA